MKPLIAVTLLSLCAVLRADTLYPDGNGGYSNIREAWVPSVDGSLYKLPDTTIEPNHAYDLQNTIAAHDKEANSKPDAVQKLLDRYAAERNVR